MNNKQKLKNALINAVKKLEGKKIALALSGGLDSSVLAKLMKDLKIKFKCYSVVFGEKCKDAIVAKSLAKELKLNFKEIIVKNGEGLAKEVIKITGKSDPITVGVGMPILAIAKEAKKDRKKILVTGLGSDEALCGYNSHIKALTKGHKVVEKECKRRIEKEVLKDIERDKSISDSLGLQIAAPFLEKEVVKVALSIPIREKISKTNKKIVLRNIAEKMALPIWVYKRKKLAAQYGSGSNKLLKKLSKKHGFSTMGSYLDNLYKQVYKKQ